ncbi:transposase [Niallia circulans]
MSSKKTTGRIVYGTIIVPINCSKKDYKYLSNCNRLSAQVWNIVLGIADKFREENNGKWIDKNLLQRLTKKCVPLHAKGIHHVVHKYLFAREAAVKAKQGNGVNNKYPHRKRQYFTTGWDSQSVRVKGNHILLSKPEYTDKNGKVKRQKPLKLYVKSIPDNIVEVELVYKKELMLAIKYKDKSEKLQIKSNNHASIDLGEIHSITSIDSCGNAIIITGRKMRAIKQHRNKIQADIYRRMSKCKKGSNQYRKYLRALKNMKWKYDNKILDCIHKISKLYLDYCILNDVSTVYYGDLDSATRNTKRKLINLLVKN